MNTLRFAAVMFLASATTVACSGEQVKMQVKGYRAPCVGIAVFSCMVTENANGPSFFYDGIEGFEFKWGVDQTIIAEITEIDDPPADGSSLEYKLVEVLSTRDIQAGERFSFGMSSDYATIEGSEFALPDGRRMACADSTLCDDVRARLGGTERFNLEVAHPSDPKDASLPLEIVSVSDARLLATSSFDFAKPLPRPRAEAAAKTRSEARAVDLSNVVGCAEGCETSVAPEYLDLKYT